jgi:hypothetical protein
MPVEGYYHDPTGRHLARLWNGRQQQWGGLVLIRNWRGEVREKMVPRPTGEHRPPLVAEFIAPNPPSPRYREGGAPEENDRDNRGAIKLRCPHCRLEFDNTATTGTVLVCPGCAKRLRVPDARKGSNRNQNEIKQVASFQEALGLLQRVTGNNQALSLGPINAGREFLIQAMSQVDEPGVARSLVGAAAVCFEHGIPIPDGAEYQRDLAVGRTEAFMWAGIAHALLGDLDLAHGRLFTAYSNWVMIAIDEPEDFQRIAWTKSARCSEESAEVLLLLGQRELAEQMFSTAADLFGAAGRADRVKPVQRRAANPKARPGPSSFLLRQPERASGSNTVLGSCSAHELMQSVRRAG